ncbi:MAG: 3'(2'),5'-bisphosphate nucleotidase CysQ [Erysipelotrichaceae bacterium]|nr:3'(2'),5'-bisphosphate nucleotidase CysQ [Erysipelotrichaceae bacterium]
MELTLIDLHRIREIAIKAGALIMEIYETPFEVKTKADDSPLTQADVISNEYIIKELKKFYPHVFILSEESKDDLNRLREEWLFVVDPLDGTKEFIKHNGQFTVNIALVYRQRPVLGVIVAPVLKKHYYALKDMGAYEDTETELNRCLCVSDKLIDLNFVGSASHQSQEEEKFLKDHASQIKDRKQIGSSIKGCMVASGEADVYYRFGKTSEWDTAAMHIIVEEAGGIFRELDGKPLIYNRFNVINEKGFFAVNRKENIWTQSHHKI